MRRSATMPNAVLRGMFATVAWRVRQVLGGFAPPHRLKQVATPAVPVCE